MRKQPKKKASEIWDKVPTEGPVYEALKPKYIASEIMRDPDGYNEYEEKGKQDGKWYYEIDMNAGKMKYNSSLEEFRIEVVLKALRQVRNRLYKQLKAIVGTSPAHMNMRYGVKVSIEIVDRKIATEIRKQKYN